jgi:hypothetical protein
MSLRGQSLRCRRRWLTRSVLDLQRAQTRSPHEAAGDSGWGVFQAAAEIRAGGVPRLNVALEEVGLIGGWQVRGVGGGFEPHTASTSESFASDPCRDRFVPVLGPPHRRERLQDQASVAAVRSASSS